MFANKPTVGLFIPCCVDQYAPATGMAMVRLLEGLGLDCYYPQELTCCGKDLYHQGDRDTAKALGEKLIEQFGDCTHIVSCGSGCVTYMKVHFGRLFHNTTLHNSYRQFLDKTYDLSDFLVNVIHYQPTDVIFPHRVAFMDHCTTMRDYVCTAHPDHKGLTEEPRQLLRAVNGLELVEMAQADVCCGFGGQFANHFTPISDSLAKRKVDNALAAGAEYIVSTEMSCLLHLKSYFDKVGTPISCLHLAELLAPPMEEHH